MSCGICVRMDDKEHIDSILKNNIIEYKNIYFKEENGYIVVE